MIVTLRKRPGEPPRSLGLGRVICLLCALALTWMAIPALATEGGVSVAGRFDRKNANNPVAASGNILVDAETRRIYQAVATDVTTIYEYDLDTLGLLRETKVPLLMPAETRAGPVEWLWTLDDARRRIFMFQRVTATYPERYRLFSFDLASFQASEPVDIWPLADRVPLAISYHAPSDRLYVLSRVANIDLDNRGIYFLEERRPDASLVWSYRLTSCYKALDQQYAPTVARSLIDTSLIYLNCYNSGGVQGQVVRLHLADSGGVDASNEEVFPAVPPALSTMFDPGSDRMIFLTTNSGAGRGAWVFDGLQSSFAGVIATGDSRPGAFDYSMGLDQASGRLYLHTPAGLVVSNARRTPLPAGLLFKEFAQFGSGAIQVDPKTHRLFVPDSSQLNLVRQPTSYLVLVDETAGASAGASFDPDALTVDADEREGETGVIFSGGSKAFAARSLTTGGVQRALWNVTLGQFSPSELDLIWSGILTVPIDQGNRDIYAARVRAASLTPDAADASALVAESDNATLSDLNRSGLSWPFGIAECHDSGGNSARVSRDHDLAWSSCDADGQSVSSEARMLNFEAGEIKARDLFAGSSVVRDPNRGLVSRASGIIGDLNILGRVRIGQVRSEAEAVAKGRPGSAAASYARTIADLQVDFDGDGTTDFKCDQCDPSIAKEAINRALAGQAFVDFPQPDEAYYPKGSPRGFQAIVEKDRHQHHAERALNDDDSLEVPAMTIVIQADARAGRSRQIIQLAGVQVESHYGVFLIPKAQGAANLVETVLSSVPVTMPTVSAVDRVTPPDVAEPPTRVAESFIEKVPQGWKVFLAGPADAGLTAALLAFLVLPAYMVARRRFLIDR